MTSHAAPRSDPATPPHLPDHRSRRGPSHTPTQPPRTSRCAEPRDGDASHVDNRSPATGTLVVPRPPGLTHTLALYTHKSSRRGPPCSWIHKTTLLAPGGPPPVRTGHGSSSCDDARGGKTH
eukprot:scaffold12146_cov53-Phaeocystis_antarctica.AAC.2